MELDVLTHLIEAPAGGRKPPLRLRLGGRTTVSVTQRLSASPKGVFDAWLDPRIACKWLFATALRPSTRVAIDARVGGAFRFMERSYGEEIEYAGVYVEIVGPTRLVFTLSLEDHPDEISRVAVDISPLKTADMGLGAKIILTHQGVPKERAERIEARWTGMLYGLNELLGR
jgi:uncharacterized protein YndB with AHSA1/START domain